jgi:hypothetical protein
MIGNVILRLAGEKKRQQIKTKDGKSLSREK